MKPTRGIADIITIEGLINVDFADVRAVMNHSGEALMGCGIASGENRAIEAAQKAISSPLLEGINIKGAKSVLLNVTGSSNLTMQEINEGNNVIFDAAGEEANVIFGCVRKEEMNDYVSYTVIATGFAHGGACVSTDSEPPLRLAVSLVQTASRMRGVTSALMPPSRSSAATSCRRRRSTPSISPRMSRLRANSTNTWPGATISQAEYTTPPAVRDEARSPAGSCRPDRRAAAGARPAGRHGDGNTTRECRW